MTHKGAQSRNQQSMFGEGKGLQNHDISGPENSRDHETKSSLLRIRLATAKTASRHKLPFWEQCGLCSFIDSSRRKISSPEWADRGPQDLRNVASPECLGLEGSIQGFPNPGHYLHPSIHQLPGLVYRSDPF